MSAHTASQIVSIVSVGAADQPVAVAGALAVVSDALKSRAASSSRWQAPCNRLDAAAHRTGSPGGSLYARPAPQLQVAHPRPWFPASRAGSQTHGIHEIFCGKFPVSRGTPQTRPASLHDRGNAAQRSRRQGRGSRNSTTQTTRPRSLSDFPLLMSGTRVPNVRHDGRRRTG